MSKRNTRKVQRHVQQDTRSAARSQKQRLSFGGVDVMALVRGEADGLPPAAPSAVKKINPGWFKRGQRGPRFDHGLYSDSHLPESLAWLPSEVERFRGAQLVDEGEDESNIPTRRRAALANRTICHKLILKLAHALDARGIADSRGKLRQAWLQQLGSYIDRAARLDNLLGLERRTKQLYASPLEWLEASTATAEREQQQQTDDAEHTDDSEDSR